MGQVGAVRVVAVAVQAVQAVLRLSAEVEVAEVGPGPGEGWDLEAALEAGAEQGQLPAQELL